MCAQVVRVLSQIESESIGQQQALDNDGYADQQSRFDSAIGLQISNLAFLGND